MENNTQNRDGSARTADFTPGDALVLARMGTERQEAAEAVAEAKGLSVRSVQDRHNTTITEQEKAERLRARRVRRYLDSLTGHQPVTRSPERELERIEKRLGQPELPSLERLRLTQQRNDLLAGREVTRPARVGSGDLEAEFVQVAQAFSASQGISRQTWVDVGVPAEVLDLAGILHPVQMDKVENR